MLNGSATQDPLQRMNSEAPRRYSVLVAGDPALTEPARRQRRIRCACRADDGCFIGDAPPRTLARSAVQHDNDGQLYQTLDHACYTTSGRVFSEFARSASLISASTNWPAR